MNFAAKQAQAEWEGCSGAGAQSKHENKQKQKTHTHTHKMLMFQFSTTFASCRPAWGQATTSKRGAGGSRLAECCWGGDVQSAHRDRETKRLRDSVSVNVSAELCVCKRHQHNFHHSAINTKYADERRRTEWSAMTGRDGGSVCSRTMSRVEPNESESGSESVGLPRGQRWSHNSAQLRERAMRARESESNETNVRYEPDEHPNERTSERQTSAQWVEASPQSQLSRRVGVASRWVRALRSTKKAATAEAARWDEAHNERDCVWVPLAAVAVAVDASYSSAFCRCPHPLCGSRDTPFLFFLASSQRTHNMLLARNLWPGWVSSGLDWLQPERARSALIEARD